MATNVTGDQFREATTQLIVTVGAAVLRHLENSSDADVIPESSAGADQSKVAGLAEAVLTEDIVNVVAIAAGLIIGVVGRELPTLLAGFLVLALLIAMLVKSSQENNEDLSQWPFWPPLTLLATFSTMSLLLCFPKARRWIVCLETGMILAVLGYAIVIAVGVEPMPVGLLVLIGVLIVGFVATHFLVRRPADAEAPIPRRVVLFVKCFSALIGGFLIVNGICWLARYNDLAGDLARTLMGVRDHTEAVDEVRLLVASWFGASIVMLLIRYGFDRCWGRRQRREEEKSNLTPETSPPPDNPIGKPASV